MPKLTKTQKEFRKKMKKLAAEGKLKDDFGRPIKNVSYPSRFNAKVIISGIIVALVVLSYARPLIHTLISGLNSTVANVASTDSTSNNSSLATSSIGTSRQESISNYIQYEKSVVLYSEDVSVLIQKYQADEAYSISEIAELRNKFNDILPYINNNCSGTDELKSCTLNVIDDNIAMLNFLEKNLGLSKTDTSVTEHNELINKMNVSHQKLSESVRATLTAENMPYYETETGIEYSYKK